MGELTITGLPDDVTILQGYFVWTGVDEDGRRYHGGVEWPFSEEQETNGYDHMATLGMVTLAKEKLIAEAVYSGDDDGEEA